MQSVFDKLYENSLAKREFRNLISIITTEENIKLAYRNLKKNAGSKTPGTDGKTIAELAKMSEAELIQVVQRKFDWYQPQAVRRQEIPKGNTCYISVQHPEHGNPSKCFQATLKGSSEIHNDGVSIMIWAGHLV